MRERDELLSQLHEFRARVSLCIFSVVTCPYPCYLLRLFVFIQAGDASTSEEPPRTDTVEPAASRFRDILAEEVRAYDREVFLFLLALNICPPAYVPVYFADPGDDGDASYPSSHRSYTESA